MKRFTIILFILFSFYSLSSFAQPLVSGSLNACQSNKQCSMKTEYCSKPEGQCSMVYQGECKTKPAFCTSHYEPVCGCDGETYGNACNAAYAGVNVAYAGECEQFEQPAEKPAIKPKSDQYLVAKARKTVKECIKSVKDPGWDIVSRVHTVSACFAGGFITDVNFYKQVHCPPNDPRCPLAPETLLATVQFGCDNTVISSQCPINQCQQDSDCNTGQWCRGSELGLSTCVNFVEEGGRCEGFVLPSFLERCEPGLKCVPTEPTGDAQGICATCNYNGTPKFMGDTFLADDGCNTCTCLDGGMVACTKMACTP